MERVAILWMEVFVHAWMHINSTSRSNGSKRQKPKEKCCHQHPRSIIHTIEYRKLFDFAAGELLALPARPAWPMTRSTQGVCLATEIALPEGSMLRALPPSLFLNFLIFATNSRFQFLSWECFTVAIISNFQKHKKTLSYEVEAKLARKRMV